MPQMEKDASASSSACVNQAYQTLLSPVSRAKYLVGDTTNGASCLFFLLL